MRTSRVSLVDDESEFRPLILVGEGRENTGNILEFGVDRKEIR